MRSWPTTWPAPDIGDGSRMRSCCARSISVELRVDRATLHAPERKCDFLAAIDPRALLIEVVRDCGAKGARVGCLTGDCGACSLELDGRLVKSCLVLAVSAAGCEIVTIEGSQNGIARAIQKSFRTCGGFRCGFRTSGMVMVAIDLIPRN